MPVGVISVQGPQTITPSNTTTTTGVNNIKPDTKVVVAGAPVNDTDDWIYLPAIADVDIGYQIIVCHNSGGAYEIRTPDASGTPVNGVDCDGTQEYLTVDTEITIFTKVSDTDGWIAVDLAPGGGVGTATTPD